MDYLVNLNLNKNELQNAVVQPLATAPTGAKEGQIYYNSADDKLYVYNGTNWISVGTDQVQANWTQTTTTAVDYIKNKPTLATVATSGSYNDLSNKPTIPTLKNVFGKVKVGSTTIEADTTQDTLELVAGSNITLTPDATNDKVTIAATDTTYSAATTSADGLMSSTDKTKLDGIATGAEVNVQSDWNQTTTTADDYIKNKPTIPSAGTGSSYPTMDGTRALGSQTGFARVDHVHPSDTSRVPTTRKVNNKALSADITLAASDIGLSTNTAQAVEGTTGVAVSEADGAIGYLAQWGNSLEESISAIGYSGLASDASLGESAATAIHDLTGDDDDNVDDAIESLADFADTLQTNTNKAVYISGAGNDSISLSRIDGTGITHNVITEDAIGSSIAPLNGSTKIDNTYLNLATSVASGNSNPVTSGAVYTAIQNLPEPMVFKGSLGTGGTITSLPTAAAGNEGYTYKVITAGTYASQAAKVGDTFISAKTGSSTYEWVLIPSGDEPSGTVTSVGISNSGLITISGSPITSSGSITIGHGTPSGASAINTAGFYKIKTDAYGHVNGVTAVAKADITGLLGDYVTSVNGSTGAVTISNATQSAAGLMSAADKTTLDNLEAASQGAITYTTLTIAQNATSVSATGVASKLITFQAYQGGEAVIVDYDGSNFSVASAAASAITIKCVVTV